MKSCIVCGVVQTNENTVKYINKRNKNKYFNSRCKQCSNKDFRERQKKDREILSDNYICKKMKDSGFTEITPQLIEVKRLLTKVKRELNVSKK